jgi:chemotaxis protein histidine kinase CheA/ActR/RegA family two-component response regulator
VSAFFDIGSLATVKNEIDQTFRHARELLTGCLDLPQAQRPLQQAQNCLHQAAGALRIIGLEGAACVACEMEIFTGMMAKRALEPATAHLHLIAESITLLSSYLDNLMAGAPDRPLLLFPHYAALQRARGLTDISPADLFFPDTRRQVDVSNLSVPAMTEQTLCEYLKACRQIYEQGLAMWVEPAQPAGIGQMCEALTQVEALQAEAALRTFWQVAGCLLDGIRKGLIPADTHLQQIATRLGLQIRKLALHTPDDSGQQILLRSMLYYLAQCRQADASIEAIRQLFQLEEHLPCANPLRPARQVDLQLQCRLRALLAIIMQQWTDAVAGENAPVSIFCLSCEKLVADLPALEQPPLDRLAAQVLATARALGNRSVTEPLALEMAAAVLLIDFAIEHTPLLSTEFPALATQQGDRLQQAAAGHELADMPAQWLALLAPAGRQAQELLLLRQVTDSVRSNLLAVAGALDAAEPPNATTDGLLQAAALLRQVAGAFTVLAADRPALLARRCMAWLEQMQNVADAANRTRRLEAIAEGVAALDLFIIGLQHGQFNHEHWLEAGLARLGEDSPGIDGASDHPPETAPSAAAGTALPMPGDHTPAALTPPSSGSAADLGRAVPAGPPGEAPLQNSGERDDRELVIGPIRVAAELFALFQQEAIANLALLAAGYRAIAEQAAPVSYDMMRAAHTLTGIARTVQCQPIAEISRALETRLHQLLDAGLVPGTPDQELICQALAVLQEMLLAFAACRYPAAAPDLLLALQQSTMEPAQASDAPAGTDEMQGTLLTQHVASDTASSPVADDSAMAAGETINGKTIASLSTADAAADSQAADGKAADGQTAAGEAADGQTDADGASLVDRLASDAIDPQLLAIFLEEAAELYPALCGDFRHWLEQPEHSQLPVIIQRSLHTLKGSARMTGANRLGALAHRMESMLLEAEDAPLSAAVVKQLEADLDQIGSYLNQLAAPAPAARAPDHVPGQPTLPSVAPQTHLPALGETPPTRTVLRVAARVIDELVNDAGEISIARAGLQENLQNIAAACNEIAGHISRLQEQVRRAEIQAESRIPSRLPQDGPEPAFDPLEFDRFTELHTALRSMTDTISEAGVLQARLLHQMERAEDALRQQNRTVRQLQQSLMHIRMVPFGTVTERFYQIARQVARQLDKNVTLAIDGEQVEIDRSVLEAITAPIEHLLRNAIDHGIEAPPGRRAAGKPDQGQVTISARPGRNEIILQIRDDGAGLDSERLRRKAAERGLLSGVTPSTDNLLGLIFLPGFSTADSVTEISGRGLGMNVVQNEITALGGRIDIESAPGRGTTFTIYLPLTLATLQVVLVSVGDELYAFPAVMVEQVQMYKKAELESLYAAAEIGWNGMQYPLYYLGHLVGGEPHPATWPLHHSVLLLESGHGRVAVHVDAIVGNQEVVVKNIGPQLARVPGIAGATVLANGREVVILNPVVLANELRNRQRATPGPVGEFAGNEAAPHPATPSVPRAAGQLISQPPVTTGVSRALIMVVDDSLTVRKVTTSFLRRSGFEVMSAKDGQDALAQMEARLPALMLVDVEMPGMDGFDLTRHLRSTATTAALPIIMITSRTADKHRNYALRLGVNAYLGKPFQEDELLQEISRLLDRQASP